MVFVSPFPRLIISCIIAGDLMSWWIRLDLDVGRFTVPSLRIILYDSEIDNERDRYGDSNNQSNRSHEIPAPSPLHLISMTNYDCSKA